MTKKILYLQPTFDLDLPRNIRSANIIAFLKGEVEIQVLCFRTLNSKEREIENIDIQRLEYSFLSKYIFNKTFSGYAPKGLLRFLSRAFNFLLRRFLFPDEWVLEQHRIIKHLLKQDKHFDIVIASMIPFSMGQVAVELQKQGLVDKVIFDIGDPLSENAALLNDPQKELKIAFEKRLLVHANKIIVTNEATKNYYASILPNNSKENIYVISQGVNEDIFHSSKNTKFDFKKLNIVYAGIFYPSLREPNAFFKVIENINTNHFIRVEIYGDSNKFGIDENASQIHFLPRVSQTELGEIYHKSNLILYIDNAYGIQTSGKIFELLILRIPILLLYSNDKSPVLELVKNINHVFCVKNDVKSIHKVLNSIVQERYFEINQDFDTTQFTWKAKAAQFAEIINIL